MSSSHFVLFIALALVETYRDIILANHMDFTDIIKFFNGNIILYFINNYLLILINNHFYNVYIYVCVKKKQCITSLNRKYVPMSCVVIEMAEHHDAKTVLSLARNLVLQLQTLIENK